MLSTSLSDLKVDKTIQINGNSITSPNSVRTMPANHWSSRSFDPEPTVWLEADFADMIYAPFSLKIRILVLKAELNQCHDDDGENRMNDPAAA